MSTILEKITNTLSGDIAFIIVTFVVVFICTMYFGKNRLVSFILSFYPAIFLYNSFPFLDKFIVLTGDMGVIINKIAIFIIFFVFIFFVINKYVYSFDESSNMVRKVGLSIAVLVLLLLFSYTTVSLDVFHDFSSSIDVLFGGVDRVFWWSLAPLALLAFI